MTSTSKAVVAAAAILFVAAMSFGFYRARGEAPSPLATSVLTFETDEETAASTPEADASQVGERRVAPPPATGTRAPRRLGRLLDTSGAPLAGVVLRRDGPHAVRWQGGDIGWVANDRTARRIDAELERRLKQDAAFAETWLSQFDSPEEWRATILGSSIPEREITSAPDGTFALGDDDGISAMRYTCASDHHVLIARGIDDKGVPTWIAARAKTVSGRTLDIAGTPIEDSFVTWAFETRPTALSTFEIEHERAPSEIRSGRNGNYMLRRVPTSATVELRARTKKGRTTERLLLPALASSFDLRFGPDKNRNAIELRGIVLDPRGQPAPGASVAIGRRTTKALENGTFSFDEVLADRGISLTAWQVGYVPAQYPSLRQALVTGRVSPVSIVLQFPAETRTLRGRIVEPSGAGVEGARIAIENPTQLDISFTPLEARVGSRKRSIVTTAGGAFELRGLAMRPYRLRVWKDGVALLVSAPIAATAQDVTLTVDVPTRRRGTVLDSSGRPVANAQLAVLFRTFSNRSGGGSMSETSNATNTNAKGEFELTNAPSRFGVLVVEDADGVRSLHPLASLPTEGELRIRHSNSGRRFVQVIPALELHCDRAFFVDEANRRSEIHVHASGRVARTRAAVDLTTSWIPWISIPKEATALVLMSGDRIVRRSTIPIEGNVLRGR